MSLLTRWFTHLERLGLPFPSNFDLNFFLSGIKIALDIDHSVSTPRTLHLLFKTLHYFPLDQRALIIQELFTQKYFYSLFFSWSYNIRDVFIALLLYQVEYFLVIRTTQTLGNSEITQSEMNMNNLIDSLNEKPTNLLKKQSTTASSSVEKTKREIARQNRIEGLQKMEQALRNIENNMQMNPVQAESEFDRSISMKKVRQTVDLSGNQGKQSQKFARQSVQQSGLLFKRAAGGGAGNAPPAHLVKQISIQSENKRLNATNSGGKSGPTGTVSLFVKTHKLFKKIQQEIDILEEYNNWKNSNINVNTNGKNNNMAINETGTASSYKGGGAVKIGEADYDFPALEREAKKIMGKIPHNLHIYIKHAINDFYKQVEEYETWKTNTANFYLNGPQGDQIVISQILPEFNMEKNMPVEDDENLAK